MVDEAYRGTLALSITITESVISTPPWEFQHCHIDYLCTPHFLTSFEQLLSPPRKILSPITIYIHDLS